ncbi:MAG TPA: tetratricopeptide repeat protein [Candidatus Polarisedimenticolia bacterium]|jgi:serine/threonine-protein kinase|nr:tetratricopeptide repeat protein [Candidatus Polarisedimenticolia bacterium]
MTTPPTPERWRRISRVLDEALEQPAEARRAHVERACASDPVLRDEVIALLARGEQAGDFLEGSPVSGIDTLSEPGGALPPEETAHDTLGPYRLLRRIGHGGMGVVYLADRADGQFEKQVALKLVRRGLDTDEILERFRRERQILARLEHPHIAHLLDGGVSPDGRPWLVMEHVEGVPITAWCAAHDAPLDERLRLFADVCETVQYAHRNLVIHRDLKPSNILVDAQGQVKLLDFGIAKLLAEEGEERERTLTRAGLRPMTPEYAAPEQALDAPLTTAADVYSLGVVLHELLVGRRPVRPAAGEPDSHAAETTGAPAPPPSRAVDGTDARSTRLRRRLRGDLDTIVLKALQPDPARRYRTVEALSEDLDRHRRGLPIRARRDTWGYRSAKFLSRHRVGTAAAVLVAVSLAAGMAGTLWQARQARREAAKAREVKDFTLRLFEGTDPHHGPEENLLARDLVDRAAHRVEEELRSQPEIQAEMMLMLGRIDLTLELFDRARPLLDGALELDRRLYGAESVQAAATLNEIGGLLIQLGKYDDAERTLREALAITERLRGRDDAAVAPILAGLSEVLVAKGEYDEAEAFDRRALAINRRALGENHLEVAMNLSDLGTLLYSRGRYPEAEPVFREALRIREGRTSDTDYDTQIVRHNLGGILAAVGRFDEAEPLVRKVLADRRRSLGPENLQVAMSLDVLGNLLRDQGQLEEAGTTLREGLDIRRRAQGPDGPDVAKSLNNIAYLELRRGDLPAARRDYEEAIVVWGKTLARDHPNLLVARNGLGMVQGESGDEEGAERALREVLDLRVAKLGEDHLMTAQSRYALGNLLVRRGRFDEAEGLLQQCLAARRKALGETHFSAVAVEEAIASLRREQGRLDESLALFTKTLSADRTIYSRPAPPTSDSLVGLGRTLLALRRPDEALPYLREGLQIRGRLFVPGDRRTAEAMTALGCGLADRGDGREARHLLEDGLPILERRPSGLQPLLSAGKTALAKLPPARG